MCLQIKPNSIVKVAKRDIVVWKYIMIENGVYKSSYKHSIIEFNTVLKSDIIVDYDTINVAFHSYKKEKDAKVEAKYWKELLVKCVIPKGSKYYIGIFNGFKYEKFICYASNQIKYLEVIKDYSPK